MRAVVARDRLFRILEEARSHPLIWLAAHPGAGKTTLVTTWLESRACPDFWVQVDSGDRDPAGFFHSLDLSVRGAGRRRAPTLPVLTLESASDLIGFARRFFRELFHSIPADSVLVLDNFQEIPEDSPLHEALVAGMNEVPEGSSVVVISRFSPPARYARLLANRSMSLIDWSQLRLTLEETRELVAQSGLPAGGSLADRLHNLSDGWAAGLTLMLERLRRNADSPLQPETETREATFQYFAGEVFDLASPENQQILLACAVLPRVTAGQAVKLSGHPGAAKLLDTLHRRHLFTERRMGSTPVFQFHSLFRDFLLSKSEELYTSAGRGQINWRAARLMEEDEDPESAVSLYLQSGKHEDATRLIGRLAPILLLQGRGQTLIEWIDTLTSQTRTVDPWLIYWRGTVHVPVHHDEAIEHLSAAFELFAAAQEIRGQALSLCGIMEAHYLKNVDFSALFEIGRSLEALVEGGLKLSDANEELRVLTNLVAASLFNSVHDPRIRDRVSLLVEMLGRPLNPGQRMLAAHAVFRHLAWSARFDLVARVVELTQPLLDHPSVARLNQFIWWVRLVHCYLFMLKLPEARQAAMNAEGMLAEIPHHPAKTTLGTFLVSLELFNDDIAGAQRASDRTVSLARSHSAFERGLAAIAQIQMALRAGQLERGLALVRIIIDAFNTVRNTGVFCEYRICHVHILHELGQSEAARIESDSLRRYIDGSFLSHYQIGLGLVEAYAAHRKGDTAGADRMLRHLIPSIDRTSLFPLRALPGVLETLVSRCFTIGLETAALQGKVQQWKLKPVDPNDATWPWPIRIRALGPFEVTLDLPSSRIITRQRKVVELLMRLVAQGGKRVPATRIIDDMWPDAEGDTAQSNLEVYLSRLRKSLGASDAISSRDGFIQLSPEWCWIDLWAFQDGLTKLSTLHPDSDEWLERAQATLALYSGHLLSELADAAWVSEPRERLSKLWIKLTLAVAERLVARNDLSGRETLLCQALAVEPDNLRLVALRAL